MQVRSEVFAQSC